MERRVDRSVTHSFAGAVTLLLWGLPLGATFRWLLHLFA